MTNASSSVTAKSFSVRDSFGTAVLAIEFVSDVSTTEADVRAVLFLLAAGLSSAGLLISVDVDADSVIAHPTPGLEYADLADALSGAAARAFGADLLRKE